MSKCKPIAIAAIVIFWICLSRRICGPAESDYDKHFRDPINSAEALGA
jgi:hypothetical protein